MYHDFNFASVLSSSARAAWQIEDILPEGAALDFTRPFEATNFVEYKLQPKGSATQVSWDMHGPMPFISKVMCVFVDLDTMIGKDFETGLANLKMLAEK